jgi:parvulin-like peptidyl-prolyl isomerase
MLQALNRPWLHFVVLGTALFLFLRWLNPPPKPVIGPLTGTRVETLQRQWISAAGRLPDEAQLRRMVAAELDRDMLFQEALAMELHRYDSVVQQRLIRNMRFLRMGEDKNDEQLYREALRMELHLGDEVVKRRLIQLMEQILLAEAGVPAPTADQVQASFEQRKEELRRPPRLTIEHVFLPRERAPEIATALARIEAESWTGNQARELSSPFLPGYRFTAQSPAQLARHFGAAFVMNLEAQRPLPGTWVGPVESTYGFHLVWVEAIEPARDARLEEVQRQLTRDLALQLRDETLRDAVAALRQGYEVRL